MRTVLFVTLAACGVLAVGCSGSGPRAVASPAATASPAVEPIQVSLKEWAISLSVTAARAGRTAFSVRNDGTVPHDLVLLRTDIEANRLPTSGGRVDERQVEVVGRTAQLTPGSGAEVSLDLGTGNYVFICNVIGHYNSGQFAAFTVQ